MTGVGGGSDGVAGADATVTGADAATTGGSTAGAVGAGVSPLAGGTLTSGGAEVTGDVLLSLDKTGAGAGVGGRAVTRGRGAGLRAATTGGAGLATGGGGEGGGVASMRRVTMALTGSSVSGAVLNLAGAWPSASQCAASTSVSSNASARQDGAARLLASAGSRNSANFQTTFGEMHGS